MQKEMGESIKMSENELQGWRTLPLMSFQGFGISDVEYLCLTSKALFS